MKHTDTGEHIIGKPCRPHEGHEHRHHAACGHIEELKGAAMKMKDKTVIAGNGLAALAARHKGAARAHVGTRGAVKTARPGLDRKSRNNFKKR